MVARSETREITKETSGLTEQAGGAARGSVLSSPVSSRDMVPGISDGELHVFQATSGQADKPLSSVTAGTSPVVGVEAGRPAIRDGRAGGPPRDGDGLPGEASGEAPMDRERARGILLSISDLTEEDFVGQESMDHIGGHSLGEIQQAVAIRAAELFEERGVEPNQFNRQSLSKRTPQV